ncbi:MAG: alpha/beta hydrolase [Mycobacteriaceae bacterium]
MRSVVLMLAAVPVFLGLIGSTAVVLAPTAQARPSSGIRSDEWVYSGAMNRWILVQVQWAKRGGNAALYLLDGLRARDDWNGWDIETDAFQQFAENNITVVMPVGGQSSFYSDWYFPSNSNNQNYTYKWETFLTQELPSFLERRGVSRYNNAIAGVSMGATAAITLAAYHRDQFRFAGSFSGYLNISAPGMPEAIRIALLDAGQFNADSMWGPPWDPAWRRNDPYVSADRLRNMPLYISAASGLPGQYNNPSAPIDYFNTATGMGIEALSLLNTRSFQTKANSLGLWATYSFPAAGTHMWRYWQDELWNARPIILNTLNAW